LKTAAKRSAAATLVLCALAGPVLADAGTELTFNLGVKVKNDSNPDLTPVGSGSSTTAGLDLSFGLTSETAQSNLSLQVSAGLFTADGSGAVDNGLSAPAVTLSYTQSGGNADLDLKASFAQTDVADDVIDNFQTGTGTRAVAGLSAGLTFGTGGPLGFGLTAGTTDISYHDNPAPGLLDSRTDRLGATLRSDLSPVLHANFGLSQSRFTQDGAAARDTSGLSAGLTLDRPTGALTLGVTYDDTPEGGRSGLNFQHQITMAAGNLTYGLGATKGVTGTTYLGGNLTYTHDLPTGALTVNLSRAVQPGVETDAETLQSRASLGYTQAVTPRGNLAVNLNWAEQQVTATDTTTANTSLSATWSQDLTQDWALDLGYTHRLRDQDGVGQGESDTVSLELRRAFALRF
jgi:hypothetical protein